MRFAETLTVRERKTAEKHAVRSTWFGCFSEKLFANTALIVIYLTMMGAGDSFTMFISSIASISGIFFMIPCAGLTAKLGLRMTYTFTCITGCCAFLGMALAPFCGVYGKYILILTFFILFLLCLFKKTDSVIGKVRFFYSRMTSSVVSYPIHI